MSMDNRDFNLSSTVSWLLLLNVNRKS